MENLLNKLFGRTHRKEKSTPLNEKKDPSKLFLNSKHHYYYLNKRHLGGNSLAHLILEPWKKKTFKSTKYSRARAELGEEYHYRVTKLIHLLQKDPKLDIDKYIDKQDEGVAEYLKTWTNEVLPDLDIKNILTEHSFVGDIKNKTRLIRAAGTFDAFDHKKGILYEWKTGNNINEDKWHYQTFVYAHLLEQLGFKINKINTHYVRFAKWRIHPVYNDIQWSTEKHSYLYETDWNKERKEHLQNIHKTLLKEHWEYIPKNAKIEIKDGEKN